VRVRFLIFDFVHGDAAHVARMVGRSRDVLCALGNDTVDGLLWLREEARRTGVAAVGVPAIDGLGPRGAGFHTSDEYVELASFGPKAEALLRFLHARWLAP
jgi:hypothetical protein